VYKTVILPLAKSDIREAAIWYNKKQPGLGKRFTKEVRETILFVRRNPKAYSVRHSNIRTAVLSIFPFMIHYIISETDKTIIILAVLHTSRNPDVWKHYFIR